MNQNVLPAKFWIENSAAFCRASRLDFPIPTPIFLPQNQACNEKHRLNGQSTKVTHLRKGRGHRFHQNNSEQYNI